MGNTDAVTKKNQDVVRVINTGAGLKANGIAAGMAAIAGLLAGAGATKALEKRPAAQRNGAIRNEETPESNRQPAVGAFDYEAAGVQPGSENSIKGRVVTFGRKRNWRWFGRILQVQNRYGELNGNNLAAAITLQIFLALIPLVVIATSVVGFIARGSANDVPGQIIAYFGITDPGAVDTVRNLVTSAANQRGWAAFLGFLTLLYSALGVAAALEYAYNQAWQASNRGIKDKAVGLIWMVGAAGLFALSIAATTVLEFLPAFLGILGVLAGIVVTFVLWVFTSVLLPNVKVAWKAVVPGAIIGTIGLEAIKYLAGLLPVAVGGADNKAYGAIGAAIGIIAALYIFGRIVVYGAVTNVVLFEGKHGTTKATIEMPTPAAVGADGTQRSGQADK